MKKIFSLIIIAAIAFTQAFANDNPSIVVRVSGKSILVDLNEVVGDKATIKFYDSNKNVLVKKDVREYVTSMLFILEELVDGTYSIELKDGIKISRQTVIIHEDKVYIDQKVESTFIPAVDVRKGYIKVNVLAKNSTIKIVINDEKGNKVFEDNYAGLTVEKIIDTRKLANGNYFMNLHVNDKTFSYTINK
jgi:hypothetical protein